LLDHLVDTAVILAVVVANAGHRLRAGGQGRAGDGRDPPDARAARGGAARRPAARTVEGALVPGDIVLLEAGDKVPADLRLLRGPWLQMQEAILTGESVPVDKQTRAVEALDAALGDRTCMAFSGTTVTGAGPGVVVATGALTEIGRISGCCRGRDPDHAAGRADGRIRALADPVHPPRSPR
jgi:magnesium-transporting ATPase (P-type)